MWATGTWLKTSREMAVMIGRIMIARIMPAKKSVERPEKPASPKKGIQPSVRCRKPVTGSMN